MITYTSYTQIMLRYVKPRWYQFGLKRWLKYCDKNKIKYQLVDRNGKTIK